MILPSRYAIPDTGEKRTEFYIYSEQYADIFQFVGHASEMN